MSTSMNLGLPDLACICCPLIRQNLKCLIKLILYKHTQKILSEKTYIEYLLAFLFLLSFFLSSLSLSDDVYLFCIKQDLLVGLLALIDFVHLFSRGSCSFDEELDLNLFLVGLAFFVLVDKEFCCLFD